MAKKRKSTNSCFRPKLKPQEVVALGVRATRYTEHFIDLKSVFQIAIMSYPTCDSLIYTIDRPVMIFNDGCPEDAVDVRDNWDQFQKIPFIQALQRIENFCRRFERPVERKSKNGRLYQTVPTVEIGSGPCTKMFRAACYSNKVWCHLDNYPIYLNTLAKHWDEDMPHLPTLREMCEGFGATYHAHECGVMQDVINKLSAYDKFKELRDV